MGRKVAIRELKFNPKQAIYARENGTKYTKLTAHKHARVEQRGNLKTWTILGFAEKFDPEEIVEVIEE